MATPLSHRLAASLDAARRALGAPPAHAPPAPRVVRRRDGAPAVAFLAALTPEGDCHAVIPLRAGENVVGRQRGSADHDGQTGDTPLVEAAQWRIRCAEDRTAEIADAWSTNGSFLVPAAARAAWPEHAAVPHLRDAASLTGAVPLVHPAYSAQTLAWQPIGEGDLLVACYSTFVLGWV